MVVSFRGDDGLTVAKLDAFDVVITDLKMPGLSGLELVGQLHAVKPKLPIILMTAYGSTETTIEATRLGAFEYVHKPFEMKALMHGVERWLLGADRGPADRGPVGWDTEWPWPHTA